MYESPTERRILEFLHAHPGAPLRVAVGYSSIWGLAWLAQHTQDRPVELLIGDIRNRFFKNATESDRRVAAEFLSRNDVRVCNWYKKHGGASEAHLKAWVIRTSEGLFVLTGSANLTEKGIRKNAEAMGEFTGEDARRTATEVDALFAKSWDVKERITGYIQSPVQPPQKVQPNFRVQPAPRPAQPRTNMRYKSTHSGASKRNGCLTALAWLSGAIAALVVAITLIVWAVSSFNESITSPQSDAAQRSEPTTQDTDGATTATEVPTSIDPCLRIEGGDPYAPPLVDPLRIFSKPLPECTGGFKPTEWEDATIPASVNRRVPPLEVWASGGFLWDNAKKQEFAADIENVWSPFSVWQPETDNTMDLLASVPDSDRCQFAVDWIRTKVKWDLSVDSAELTYLRSMFAPENCLSCSPQC